MTLVYHFFVDFFTGMLGTEACFFSTGYGERGGFKYPVIWSTELHDEIYELLLDDSEVANSLCSPVSTAAQIEQQLSRIQFRR